jgi:formylglycine-generating enzyme required for sulfatase activity
MNSPLRLVLLRPFILLLFSLPVRAADPVVSNISAVQRAGTQLVDITYNVAANYLAADYPLSVALQISSDAGATFTVPATTTSGAIGTGVTAGVGKLITWNAGTDWSGRVSTTMRFKVTATDCPAGFSEIPAGSFTMGDALDGISDAPTHTVTVSAFYMAQNLVTKAEWDAVRTWGLANGYTDLVAGSGKASNHPVVYITWYQMVKWCNARSQQGGFVPVYYTDDAQTTVYKTGDVNVTNAQVKWSANGFRLPTEAEWEKAARGGSSGKRFPWGDTISHSQANYEASIYQSYSYDLSQGVGYHPSYTAGGYPYTSPVGSFAANGYGLYDMAGNVWQRCWDWYGSYDPAVLADPRGPAASGSYRVFRGGSWANGTYGCRVAYRSYWYPFDSDSAFGVRVVRSSVL